MDTSKIIIGTVGGGRYTVTAPIMQEHYGIILKIAGAELPESYQVDFSNDEHHGTSVTMIGNADGVLIPRQFIDTGKDVFAFLYWVGEDYGKTVYKFRIPNKYRPSRTDEAPTPEEQSVIDQAINALNNAVEQTSQDVISAYESAQNASVSADRAERSESASQLWAETAENYSDSAEQSASQASASATESANYANASAQSASDAEQTKQEVEGLVSDAQDSANEAKGYATQASNFADDAQGHANTAHGYATDASNSADTATSKASEASGYAQTASQKATEAGGYANTSSQKASESAQSASLALGYKNDALQAKTDAETAQANAEQARDDAQTAQELAEIAESNAESTVHGVLDSLDLETTSGSIVETHDAFPVSPEKMIVDINPVQNLNGYDSPWIGGGGKNLLDTSTLLNGAYSDAQFNIPSSSSTVYRSIKISLKAGTYTLSTSVNIDVVRTLVDGGFDSTTYGNKTSHTFTTTTDGYVGLTIRRYDRNDWDDATKLQLEIGSTATDWTPYENICPISGWTEANVVQSGKNLFDNDTTKIHAVTHGTANEGEYVAHWGYEIYLPAGTYTIKAERDPSLTASRYLYGGVYKKSGNHELVTTANIWVNKIGYTRTITVAEDECILYFNAISTASLDDTKTLFSYFDITMWVGTEVGNYAPYQGRTIPINWQTEVGTVYGGKLDVLSGVLTVEMGMLDMSTASWTLRDDTHRATTTNTKNLIKIPSSQSVKSGSIAENYTEVRASATLTVGKFAVLQTGAVVLYYDGVNAPSGKLVYPLATPIEYQLTPQQITLFKDYNALWADTGDISEFAYRVGEFATKADIPEVPVEDVQVNGTSVVQNKVANIDLSGIEQNAEDIASLKEDTASLEDDRYKPYAVDSASGSIASFSDGADDIPLKSLVVSIEPKQDGTGDPSPDNVRPISGWTGMQIQHTGKNLFYPPQIEERTYRGITVSVSGDTYTVTGTASGGAETRNLLDNSRGNFYTSIRLRDNIWVEAGTYTFTAFRSKDNGSVGMVYGTDLDETYTSANNHYISLNSPATLTFSEKTYITPFVSFSNGVASDYTMTFQIESGTASTEYEPYVGTTIPINWQTEAGTVYGGKLDVLSGVMTVTHSYMQLVLTGWALSGSNFWHSLTTMSNTRPAQVGWCTHYKNEVTATGNNTIIFGYSSFSATPRIIVRDSRFTTASDFMAFLAEQETNGTPVMIAYPLATPIEIQFTPHEVASLLGTNNIFADTGDTACEYRADTTLYIQRLTEPDADMIADSNITSGKYFMVGNNLYLATANIASGASVIVGTNAIRKSLSEALNEINS